MTQLHHRYNGEEVRIGKRDLELAIILRDMIYEGKITHQEAVKQLNNPLILI